MRDRFNFRYTYNCFDCKFYGRSPGTYAIEKHIIENPSHIIEMTVKNVTKAVPADESREHKGTR